MRCFRTLAFSCLVVGTSLCGKEFLVDVNAPKPGAGTVRRPFTSIADAVAAAGPGDVVTVRPGVYRESVRLACRATPHQPFLLRAASASEPVVLTGTDIITGWTKAEGQVWVKRPWTTIWCRWSPTMSHGADPPVGRCEQVVCDGKLLGHVCDLQALRPGTFFADPKETKSLSVWLPGGASPEQCSVEVAVRNRLLAVEGSHIHVSGLTFRYAANHAQHGAVAVTGNRNTLTDCTVEWTNGTGLTFHGTKLLLRRITCRYNGQLGMGGGGENCTIADCTLIGNNIKGFPAEWEAGGIKVVGGQATNVSGMTSVANAGPGIWYDIDNRGCAVTGCWVEKNAGSGIFIEISGRGGMVIRDNVCIMNGTAGGWGSSGISLGESMDCRVYNNLCAGNPTGIGIREQGPRTFQGREKNKAVTYYTTGHSLHHNICAYNTKFQFGLWYDNVFFGPHPSPDVGKSGTPLDPAKSGLRMHHNLYWPAAGQRLVLWGCPWRPKHTIYDDLASFRRATRLDTGSVVADPQFVDPDRANFALKPESPALAGPGGRKGPARIERPPH